MMKKALALVLALCMVLAACSAMADGAIKISTIGPLTGPYASYGLAVANALKLTVEEANAQGGVQFEVLEPQDDQGAGDLALNAYYNLRDQGLQILLGTVTSGACMVVAGVAVGDRVFMLTPSASSDGVPAIGDNVFQICFTDSSQGTKAADYIKDHSVGTKIGIIYNNAQDYSIGIYNSFKAQAAALGLEIVAEKAYSDDNASDFSAQVNAMKDAGADLVFIPIYYTPAYKILDYARSIEYAPVFFGVDGMDGILDQTNVKKEVVEGLMYLTPFAPNSSDERSQAFANKYREMFGIDAIQFAADEYDAVYVLKELCEKAGITADTPADEACEKLIAEITNGYTYEGITGTMTWDPNGTVTKEPKAAQILDGKYVMAE